MDDASFFKLAMTEDQAKFDASLPVRFEYLDIEDPVESKKSGYARYKRITIIRTLIPGSKDDRVDRVNEGHKLRFPRAWAAFQAGEEGVTDGTALREFPGLTKDDVSIATHANVLSVEQLAALSDEQASQVGHNWRQRRDAAKAWLAARKSEAPVAELNAALDEERQKRMALEARLAALEGTPVARPEPKKRIRKKAEKPAEG